MNITAEEMIQIDRMVEIGQDLSSFFGEDVPPLAFFLVVGPSTILPCFIVEFDNIYYDIAYNNNIVNAIFVRRTQQPHEVFKTPENVYIGMSYREFSAIFPDMELKKMPGWGYGTQMPSGWKIVWMSTEHFPTENDEVTAIYKNNLNVPFP
jgi:hypothetical protein